MTGNRSSFSSGDIFSCPSLICSMYPGFLSSQSCIILQLRMRVLGRQECLSFFSDFSSGFFQGILRTQLICRCLAEVYVQGARSPIYRVGTVRIPLLIRDVGGVSGLFLRRLSAKVLLSMLLSPQGILSCRLSCRCS